MSFFTSPLARFLIPFGVGAALCAAVVVPWHRAQVAELKLAQTQAVADARAADAEVLRLAEKHGDKLTANLQKTRVAITQKNTEVQHALNEFTDGHACLSAGAVRVLNSAATAYPTDLSPPTAGAVGAGGPIGTDSVSDRDIAAWAANARSAHDDCRARLDALIDFFGDLQ